MVLQAAPQSRSYLPERFQEQIEVAASVVFVARLGWRRIVVAGIGRVESLPSPFRSAHRHRKHK